MVNDDRPMTSVARRAPAGAAFVGGYVRHCAERRSSSGRHGAGPVNRPEHPVGGQDEPVRRGNPASGPWPESRATDKNSPTGTRSVHYFPGTVAPGGICAAGSCRGTGSRVSQYSSRARARRRAKCHDSGENKTPCSRPGGWRSRQKLGATPFVVVRPKITKLPTRSRRAQAAQVPH